MKKTNLLKIFSILLIIAMVVAILSSYSAVFAANEDDEWSEIGLTNSSSSNSSNNTNTNELNTNTNTNNANKNTNNTNTSNTNRNASIYNTNNTSNLPKTGIADSAPVAMLIVLFTISSIYAYRKIKEYRNI